MAAASILLAGCTSPGHHSGFREISSTPPVKAIELTVPATASGEEGATSTFPVGKYTPAYEDDHGFYFEAPRKVLVDDIATYAFDGGIIVERGQTAPTHWYIIRPNGRRSTGKFKTMPVYKIVQ
jgi:hypothetical protein